MKALVWNKAMAGRSAGDIQDIAEDDNIDGRSGNLYEHMDKVEVSLALEDVPRYGLKAALIPDTWSKYEEADTTTDPEDETWTLTPEHYEIQAKVTGDYSQTERIAKEGTDLATGVYADLDTAFGVDKAEPATGWGFTAQRMSDNPSFFAGEGLSVIIATTSFAAGAALDTTQKCTDYSGELLAAMDKYLADRMVRYGTYATNKATIEAE